jgi:hypothetical protein
MKTTTYHISPGPSNKDSRVSGSWGWAATGFSIDYRKSLRGAMARCEAAMKAGDVVRVRDRSGRVLQELRMGADRILVSA